MTSAPVRDPIADHLLTAWPSPRSTRCGDGYEVYPVVDAIGGTSPEADRAGLDRVLQAGGQPISWVWLAVELQRDWGRQETVQAVIEIVLTDRLLKSSRGREPYV